MASSPMKLVFHDVAASLIITQQLRVLKNCKKLQK